MASPLPIARRQRKSRPSPWLATIAGMLLAGAMAGAVATADGQVADRSTLAAGQRIYREGILPSGQPLRGRAKPGMVRTGAAAACAACHRRSGYGMTEGNFAIRPITAAALFQSQPITTADPRIAHQLGLPIRPAYNEQSLARAIRDGVDMTGRPLSDAMPRYAIGDQEIKPLLAYLKSLAAEPAPGVSDADIHLATVIQPGVSAEKRRAMLDVLAAFLRDKNAGTRWDEHRRQAGIMRMQRAYRRWNLHVWELNGTPDTWGAQLAAYYRQQPVFAIVGGLGGADWGPIHQFSEQFQVPCVFPQAELPGQAGPRFYTLYLSRGILLEADVLARYLADKAGSQRLVQVFRRDTLGAAAAHQFRAALPDAAQRLTDLVLNDGPADSADRALWPQLAQERSGTALILWLNAADLDSATALITQQNSPPTVYLSSTLLDGLTMAAPLAAAGVNTLLVYPWDNPAHRDTAQHRTNAWLKRNNLVASDDAVQANTFFTVNIVGDVLSHILDSFSREYFVERIEHAVQQSLVPSGFPHVSLGPDQRFAAKGSYVVRLAADKSFAAVSDWIVP
jgi:hypothetical protein